MRIFTDAWCIEIVGTFHLRRSAATFTLRGALASESDHGIVGCETQETNELSVLINTLEWGLKVEPFEMLDRLCFDDMSDVCAFVGVEQDLGEVTS